jgi:hypothetical protein
MQALPRDIFVLEGFFELAWPMQCCMSVQRRHMSTRANYERRASK